MPKLGAEAGCRSWTTDAGCPLQVPKLGEEAGVPKLGAKTGCRGQVPKLGAEAGCRAGCRSWPKLGAEVSLLGAESDAGC